MYLPPQVTATTYNLITKSTVYKGIYLPWQDSQLKRQERLSYLLSISLKRKSVLYISVKIIVNPFLTLKHVKLTK